MRFRLLGVAAAVVVIVATAACGDSATAPAESVVGTYHLSTINGHGLPFDFPPDSFGTTDTAVLVETIGPEQIRLFADGSADDQLTFTDTWTQRGVPTIEDRTSSKLFGRWEDAGAQIRFLTDSGYGWGNFPAPWADTLRLATPATLYYDKGRRALIGNFHHKRHSLGPSQPATEPYAFVYTRE